MEWNHVEIVQLQQVNKKIMLTIDFCLDSIVVGFIIKFAVDIVKSYNETE
jgi:hypothetical protein